MQVYILTSLKKAKGKDEIMDVKLKWSDPILRPIGGIRTAMGNCTQPGSTAGQNCEGPGGSAGAGSSGSCYSGGTAEGTCDP